MEEAYGEAYEGLGKRERPIESLEDRDGEEQGPPESLPRHIDHNEVDSHIVELETHVKTFKLHLTGKADDPCDIAYRCLPTFVPPSGAFWTPHEKAAFFASLARHSKWRTDLIAADLCRPEGDVLDYIQLLEGGVDTLAGRYRSKEGFRDRLSKHRSSYMWRPGRALAAEEVTDEYMRYEERLAELAEEVITNAWEERRALDKEMMTKKGRQALGTEGKKRGQALLAEMEAKAERENWGASLDSTKLGALSSLLETLAELHARNADETRTRDSLSSEQTPDPSDDSHLPFASNKYARIAMDNITTQRLQAIPPRERSLEQKAVLTKLLNRKFNRERYRTKQLLEQGVTEEEIEEQGGADAVFHARIAKLSPPESPRRSASPRKQRPVNDEITKTLRHIGMDKYIEDKGWDLFSFNRLREWLETGFENPLLPSFQVLDLLYSELLKYLKPLILDTIIVAEQAAAQRIDVDQDPGIEDVHVMQALALRNEKLPTRKEIFFRLTGKSLEDSRETAALRDSAQPPGNLPWAGMSIGANEKSVMRVFASADADVNSILDWDAKSTLTDDEDQALDEAMEEMDEAYDELAALDLRVPRQVLEPAVNRDWAKGRAAATAKNYHKHQDETAKARRRRRAIRARKSRKPKHKLKTKSKALIVDSEESEIEMLDGDYDEEIDGGFESEERSDGALDSDSVDVD